MAFQKPQRAVDRVFVHCSASDRAEHDNIAVIRRWHVEDRGWNDVGYHYFIRKDGSLEAGRDLEKIPAAQKGHNTGSIAICLHGLAAEKFTKTQFKKLIELCKQIDDAYGGMVTFHGHHEVANKACPVFPYKQVLGLDSTGSMDFATTVSPAMPRPGDASRPTLRLTDKGPAVTELQHLLSEQNFEVEEDGMFGQITHTAELDFQRRKGLAADGIVGPQTWAALTG